MRPASGFSGFTTDAKKASWEELARERDDGETKNYSVPPELIELARANRKARGQVGTLTPLAPKPSQEVVVVVPAASPVARDMRAPELASSPQAPSVPAPAGAAGTDPDSERTAVAAVSGPRASAPPAPASAPSIELSPLAAMMRAELAVARGEEPDAAQPSEAPAMEAASEVPADPAQPAAVPSTPSEAGGLRRTSRRARRSLRIEMPSEASAAARAVGAVPVRSRNYVPVALGAVIVGAYVVLCYYANAMLSGLP